MFFNSSSFWIFFPAVAVIHYILPQRWRWIWLLAASLTFYSLFDLRYGVLLVFLAGAVYLAGMAIGKQPDDATRRILLLVPLILIVGILAFFKYSGNVLALFTSSTRSASLMTLRPFFLILPVGLSFYSFRLISYLVDVYWRRVRCERHFGRFALYVSYFPDILSGPIQRSEPFLSRLRQTIRFHPGRIGGGIRLILWGLFKKMAIADRLDLIITRIFSSPDNQGLAILIAAYFYAFQIYCDFSGYTDVARGASRVLGLHSPRNFAFPYGSFSIGDFWRRWHISLSTWLRDYIFLPVSSAIMHRCGASPTKWIPPESLAYGGAVFITMALGGIWHGSGWTFLAWGVLHGVFLVSSFSTRKWRKRIARRSGLAQFPQARKILQVAWTFHLVTLAWVLFRSPSISAFFHYLVSFRFRLPMQGRGAILFDCLLLIGLIAAESIMASSRRLRAWLRLPRMLRLVLYALFIALLFSLAIGESNAFIYIRF